MSDASSDPAVDPAVDEADDHRVDDGPDGDVDAPPRKRPLYPRLLRLKNISPNGWQRAALGEGALAVAVVLVLADLASAWTLLALPLGVAAVVKAHDVLAGLLRGPGDDDGAAPDEGTAPTGEQV